MCGSKEVCPCDRCRNNKLTDMVDFNRLSELTKAAQEDMNESHKEYTEDQKRAFTSGFIGGANYEQKKKNSNNVQQPRWDAIIERRIIKKMREEYEQANHMIDFATRANKPSKGGLINVESSVKDFMVWLKLELNIKEG